MQALLAFANVALNYATNFTRVNQSSRGIRKFRGEGPSRGMVTGAESDATVYTRMYSSPKGVMNPFDGRTELCGAREAKRHRVEISPSTRRAVPYESVARKPKYTGFDVLTAMQWPPLRSLSARRVSLPRRRGSRQTGVEREGCHRCRCPWQEPPRITEGQSRFHRRNALIRSSLGITCIHRTTRVRARQR